MTRSPYGQQNPALVAATLITLAAACGLETSADVPQESALETQDQALAREDDPALPDDDLEAPADDVIPNDDGPWPNQQVCLSPPGLGNWSTQLQGTAQLDYGHAVATDTEICAIFTGGETWAALAGQPFAGNSDAFVTRYSTAGSVMWTRLLGGGSFDSVMDLAVDSAHNVYATGFTYNTLPGSPTTAQGGRDVFVVKYDDAGNRQWTRQLGTAGSDTGSGIAIGANDEIYIAGSTHGLLPLATTYAGGDDFFIARFDSAGNHLWTNELGGTGDEGASDIALGLAGNLHLVGSTDGTLNSVDGHQGAEDLFVAKYNASGGQLWIHQRGSSGSETAAGVAVNDSGQIFLTGSTSHQLDGHVSHGSWDILVMRYDANGTWQWTDQRGTAQMDQGIDIAVNSFGHAFSVGYTDGALDGNVHAGAGDMYLMKHGHSGVWRFTRQFGTSGIDAATGIAVDAADMEYVVGATQGNLGGNVNAGSDDAFATRWDSGGVLR